MPTPRRRYRNNAGQPQGQISSDGWTLLPGTPERAAAEKNGVRFGPDNRPLGKRPPGPGPGPVNPEDRANRAAANTGKVMDPGEGDAEAELQATLEERLGPDIVRDLKSPDWRVHNAALEKSKEAGLFLFNRYNPTAYRVSWTAQDTKGAGNYDKYAIYNAAAAIADKEDSARELQSAEAERIRAETEAAAKAQAERDGVRSQIQKFVDSLDVPDPAVAARIQTRAMDAAQGFQGRTGTYGRSGLGASTAAGITASADAEYADARQARKVGALGLLQNNQATTDQLRFGYAGLDQSNDQFMTNRADQQASEAWAAQQNAGQGVGSLVGGIAGALGYLGGPAVGAATMAGGSALGGLVGGLAAGGNRGPSYQTPPPSRRGSKAGLGGGF